MEVGTPDTAQWLRANRVPEFMNTLIQELLRNKPSQPIDYLLQILAHERSRSNYNYLKTHHVHHLLDQYVRELVQVKPEDPFRFLHDRLQASRSSTAPTVIPATPPPLRRYVMPTPTPEDFTVQFAATLHGNSSALVLESAGAQELVLPLNTDFEHDVFEVSISRRSMTASSLLQSYSLDVSEPWMVLRLEGVIPTGSVQLVVPWHELENARSPSQVQTLLRSTPAPATTYHLPRTLEPLVLHLAPDRTARALRRFLDLRIDEAEQLKGSEALEMVVVLQRCGAELTPQLESAHMSRAGEKFDDANRKHIQWLITEGLLKPPFVLFKFLLVALRCHQPNFFIAVSSLPHHKSLTHPAMVPQSLLLLALSQCPDPDCIKAMLQRGYQPVVGQFTALHWAVMNERCSAALVNHVLAADCKQLEMRFPDRHLNHGENTFLPPGLHDDDREDCIEWRGYTPLMMACCLGQHKKVRALLQARADINARCQKGNTPLHVAVHSNCSATVEVLLEYGHPMECKNKEGQQPHDLASHELMPTLVPNYLAPISGAHEGVSKLRAIMTQPHMDVNAMDCIGVTALLEAVLCHDMDVVHTLVTEFHSHLHQETNWGLSLTFFAKFLGLKDMEELLLRHGHRPSKLDQDSLERIAQLLQEDPEGRRILIFEPGAGTGMNTRTSSSGSSKSRISQGTFFKHRMMDGINMTCCKMEMGHMPKVSILTWATELDADLYVPDDADFPAQEFKEGTLLEARFAALNISASSPLRILPRRSFCIYLYTMDTGLYRRTTRAMRTGVDLKPWYPYIWHLNEALDSLEPISARVYRGVSAKLDLQMYATGKEVMWSAYSSTSTSSSVAIDFFSAKGAGEQGVLFVIEAQTGRDISGCSAYPDEAELLLPRNSQFVVTGISEHNPMQLNDLKAEYSDDEDDETEQQRRQSIYGTNLTPEEASEKPEIVISMRQLTDSH